MNYENLISIVMPVFNAQAYLEEALKSVRRQTLPDVPSEDTAMWWQILRNGHVAYGLKENLVIYRRPEKSLSSNKLRAITRIWGLYRKQEKMSVIASAACFCMWAVRAVWRRI